jgi:hypothetical protein
MLVLKTDLRRRGGLSQSGNRWDNRKQSVKSRRRTCRLQTWKVEGGNVRVQ